MLNNKRANWKIAWVKKRKKRKKKLASIKFISTYSTTPILNGTKPTSFPLMEKISVASTNYVNVLRFNLTSNLLLLYLYYKYNSLIGHCYTSS